MDTLKCVASTVVEKKGAVKFAVQWILKKLEQLALTELKIRTDSEHSITALAQQVRRQREQKTLVEQAPEADHQAIGGVERFHRVMQDQLRALRMQADIDLNTTLKAEMATTKWLVRHASWVIFRYFVNRACRSTAYFRVYGKNYSGTMVHLFETVLARRAEDVQQGRRTSKWDSRWRVGVWLGKTEMSDEHLVYADGEVSHHRTIRRFAEKDPRRWQKELVVDMRVTPYPRTKG